MLFREQQVITIFRPKIDRAHKKNRQSLEILKVHPTIFGQKL